MPEQITKETMPETVRETMEAIASKNFEMWNEALKSGDPKKVAELYIDDATFLPTLSGEFKKGKFGAEKYFVHFLEKNPVGEITKEETQILAADCYAHSGMYNFEVDFEKSRQIVNARFTYIWKKDNQGNWKIIHHHSSVNPELKPEDQYQEAED